MRLSMEDIESVVKRGSMAPIQGMDAIGIISKKLSKLKKKLTKWEKISFENILRRKKEINTYMMELELKEEEESIDLEQTRSLSQFRRELEKLYCKEEIMWWKSSEIRWLSKGDKIRHIFIANS